MPWFEVEVKTCIYDVAVVDGRDEADAREQATAGEVTYRGVRYIDVEVHEVRRLGQSPGDGVAASAASG